MYYTKKLRQSIAILIVAFCFITPVHSLCFFVPKIESLSAAFLSFFKSLRKKRVPMLHGNATHEVIIVNDFLESVGTYALPDETADCFKEITISVNGNPIQHGEEEKITLSNEKCVLSLSLSINTLVALLQHEEFKILFDTWENETISSLIKDHWLTKRVVPHLKNKQSLLRKVAYYINSRIVFTYTFSAKELSKNKIALLMIMILKYGEWEEDDNWPTINLRYRPIRTLEITLSDNT